MTWVRQFGTTDSGTAAAIAATPSAVFGGGNTAGSNDAVASPHLG